MSRGTPLSTLASWGFFVFAAAVFGWALLHSGLLNGAEKPQEPDALGHAETLEMAVQPAELEDVAKLQERGEAFLRAGEMKLAAADFAAVAKRAPTAEHIEQLVRAYVRDQEYKKASAVLEKAQHTPLASWRLTALEAEIALRRQDAKEAQVAIASLPEDSPEQLVFSGLLLLLMGSEKGDENAENQQLEEVAERFLAAEQMPEMALLSQTNELATALADAAREFALFTEGEQAHQQLLYARAANWAGLHEVALALASGITKGNPEYRDAFVVLGHSALAIGKLGTANAALSRAAKIDPLHGASQFFLGLTLERLSRHAAAAQAFSAALRLHEGVPTPEALAGLARTALAAGDRAQAAQAASLLLAQRGEMADFVLALDIALAEGGNPADAIGLALRAVEAFPSSAMAQVLLAKSLRQNGNREEARRALAVALEMEPGFPPAFLERARVAADADETAAALQDFRTAYSLTPYSTTGQQAAAEHNQLLKRQ